MPPVDPEFTAYGKYRELVRCMVENDKPEKAVRYFYESINTSKVKYFVKLDDAMRYLRFIPNGITPTTILLKNDVDPASSHAVCLVKCDWKYYFFDPNGIVKKYNPVYPEYYMYYYKHHKLSTKMLITVLERKYGISFEDFPKKTGIQLFAPEKFPTYIKGGGFCMFYIYWFIEYVNYNFNMTDIKGIISYKYTKTKYGMFPSPDTVPDKSLVLIKTIMNPIISKFRKNCTLLP